MEVICSTENCVVGLSSLLTVLIYEVLCKLGLIKVPHARKVPVQLSLW